MKINIFIKIIICALICILIYIFIIKVIIIFFTKNIYENFNTLKNNYSLPTINFDDYSELNINLSSNDQEVNNNKIINSQKPTKSSELQRIQDIDPLNFNQIIMDEPSKDELYTISDKENKVELINSFKSNYLTSGKFTEENHLSEYVVPNNLNNINIKKKFKKTEIYGTLAWTNYPDFYIP